MWLDNAIFYEIYPQSFLDTDGDGIGNINGITKKLDYIKNLGCNAIWLNPCFESPFGDAGYDVSDYYKVAPRYGTNEDLKNLFLAAHERQMHVLLDLVPGHTSWDHKWFKESCKANKNEFTDRYIWTNSVWESPENMATIRGISERDGSCVVNFFSHQPALNYGFYEVKESWQQKMDAAGPMATRQEMKNIMAFWLGLGCDGFRVDMASSLVKNDPDFKGTISLWQDVRSFLDKKFPEAVLVSEWGMPDKSIEGGFHMDFLLHFGPSHYNDLFRCEQPFFSKRGKGNVFDFVEKYKESYIKADSKGLICIPSGNHDMDRLARSLTTTEEQKIAFAFLLSMPGAPFIYYGDEIGMNYVENLPSKEGGYERTGSRSPMQWDSSTNAGFSSAPKEKLYIPQDPSKTRPTAEKALKDEKSLLNFIKAIIELRHSHPALDNTGKIEFIYAQKDKYPLAYLRTSSDGTEKILVIINPSENACSFEYEHELDEILFSYGGAVSSDCEAITCEGQSAAFIKIK